MLALIVVANPSPQSLSHAMASAAERVLVARGYEIAYHDLYAEHFDPVQPTGEGGNVGSSNVLVEQHCSELARADLILVFHPNWWGQPPAILKGWIDRVFRLDTAYAYPPARLAIVVNTSNTSAEREALAFGDPLEMLWKNCVFGLCGVSSVIRCMYAPVSGSTAQQRAAWLSEVTALVENAA
jgi:putative NADPH-quinone reductase